MSRACPLRESGEPQVLQLNRSWFCITFWRPLALVFELLQTSVELRLQATAIGPQFCSPSVTMAQSRTRQTRLFPVTRRIVNKHVSCSLGRRVSRIGASLYECVCARVCVNTHGRCPRFGGTDSCRLFAFPVRSCLQGGPTSPCGEIAASFQGLAPGLLSSSCYDPCGMVTPGEPKHPGGGLGDETHCPDGPEARLLGQNVASAKETGRNCPPQPEAFS